MIFVLLFLIALVPRLYNLDATTIYPDEISWLVRGKELLFTIKNGDSNQFQTMWWNHTDQNESIALPVVTTSAASLLLFGNNQTRYSLNLFSDMTAGRIPIAILTSLIIPFFYLLAKRFVSSKIAFLFAVLLAFDPIHLALSRWIMLDAVLTLFTFLVIYFFMIAENRRRFNILAGSVLALAFLTKPLGLISITTSWVSQTKLYPQRKVLIGVIWSISAFFFFCWLLLPGSWDKPIFSVIEYYTRQYTLGKMGYNVLFMGQPTTSPPPTFYFFQLYSRLPTSIVIIFMIFLGKTFYQFLTIKNLKLFVKDHRPHIAISIFFIIFLTIISLANLKLGARYALPLWPWIYLACASTTDYIFNYFHNRLLKIIVTMSLLSYSLFNLFTYFPNYYLFYNELIGGSVNAQKHDLVGNCIATKKAFAYIKQCYPNLQSVAILGCDNVVAPYYFNGKITTDWKTENIVIVPYTYTQLLPQNEDVVFFKSQTPIYIAKENGAVLADVYSKTIIKNNSCSIN